MEAHTETSVVSSDLPSQMLLQPLRRLMLRLERSLMDPSRVETNLTRFGQGVESVFRTSRGTLVAFFSLASHIANKEGPSLFDKDYERQVFGDRAHDFVSYFANVDRRWPHASAMILRECGFASRAFTRDIFRAYGYWGWAQVRRHEPRSEALRLCAQALIEGPYYTLVECVYRAECLMNGRRMNAGRGGGQVREIERCLPAGLLDSNANHYRNASAHFSGWEYDIGSDSIVWADRSYRETVTSSQALQRIGALVADVSCLYAVMGALAKETTRESLRWGMLELVKGNLDSATVKARMQTNSLASTYRELDRLGLVS